jgi:glycosyltransferase involved in cell wall biosynthesis
LDISVDDRRTFSTSVAPECRTSAGLLVPMRRQEELTNRSYSAVKAGVTLIIPCYNEEKMIAETVGRATKALQSAERAFEIIVVDDGSKDDSTQSLQTLVATPGLRLMRNNENRGYGYSLKRAIAESRLELIAIVDADGTYPIDQLPKLIEAMKNADMAVGARTGASVHIPLARRPAKWILRKLAEYLAGRTIPDLNSGMRVMKRSLVRRFVRLLPDGFSFTTTITLALLTHGYEVRYIPIDYAPRVGKSSIRPLRDTANFLSLIVRTILYFRPLKIFVPASAGMFGLAIGAAVISKLSFGQVADVTAVTLASASLQLLAIGMLADLIDKRWPPQQLGVSHA